MRDNDEKGVFTFSTCHDLPTLGRYSVLVAEDEALERELIVEYLAEWGIRTRAAANGWEALAILKKDDTVRLLITDLQMPGMDGLQLLRTIKGTGRGKLYSIVLSGLSDRLTLTSALGAGATDYMVKPCHPEQIFARLAVLDKVMSLEEGYQALVKDLFDVMGEMLGSRDIYTLEHSLRVAAISRRTGRLLGLGQDELDALEMGCLVHDIGKIAVPDDVLLKPGSFDTMDRHIMNMHPTIGARFLAPRYPDDRVTEIVLQHHERLDGSGYPAGLKGDAIGPLVRIVAAADVCEALIAKRPYKSPMTQDQALEVLRQEARRGRLDSVAVTALEKAVENWNPLAIQRPMHVDGVTIEAFRKIAYFREPMCTFYNYRYLLALERTMDLAGDGGMYHLILIDFRNLGELNQRWGYRRADQFLDEFGENLQQALRQIDTLAASSRSQHLLCRKGADYLVFINAPLEKLRLIADLLRSQMDMSLEQWGLKADLHLESFPPTCPIEKALDQLLCGES